MIRNGQKSTVFEKTPKIRKFWQKFWFFKKIWLLSLLIFLHFYRPPSVPDKWLLINGGQKSSKNWTFWPFFWKSRKLTPPTLAPRQELVLNQALSAQFFANLSVLIHLVHLVFIWQCPSGTTVVDNILKFISFSLHPVFQRTSGLRREKYIEFWFISVSILWGRAPQKLLTKFFKILEKNQRIFFRFWVKKLFRSM